MGEKTEKSAGVCGSDEDGINITITGDVIDPLESAEVFHQTTTGVNFRTVGWPRAAAIFLKVLFATGVLGIPSAMTSLGAVPGALSVIGWGAFNTYAAIIQGNFRNNHPHCHSVVDMAGVVGGPWLKELASLFYMVSYVLATGSGIVGVSTGLNALSHHAACTVWWTLISTVAVCAVASIRKFHMLGWVTWVGFLSIFVAILIVVIGVTTRSRPAAAPQEGDFELGYYKVVHADFVSGMAATATIFVSSAGTSAFLPVIAEMKNPRDYNKAVYVAMGFVTFSYLAFSLVVYRWCGTWVASPSLASAGGTIKMVSYGIGLFGLVISACLYLHVSAKYIFVRLLRKTRHLQENTWVHWTVWISCVVGFGAVSFVVSEAIPGFGYILSLLGTTCFAPIAIILPGWLWLYDNWSWRAAGMRKATIFWLHWLIIALGILVFGPGTYASVEVIVQSYNSSSDVKAFSCADNSNSS